VAPSGAATPDGSSLAGDPPGPSPESEERRTDRALQESEARYRALFEQAVVGVALVETGTGAFLEANAALCRMLGYSREELLACTWRQVTHPEDLEADLVGVPLAEATDAGYRREKRYLRRDGSWFWASLTVSPVQLPGEAVTSQVAVVEDITRHLAARSALATAERALEERERSLRQSLDALRRLEAAVEQAPVSIVITDEHGDVEYVNPAFERTTGYSRGDVMGRNPRILKSGRHGPEVYAGLWAAISSGRVWTGTLVNQAKDGSLFTEDAVVAPVRDGEGAIRHYVAVKRDVTAELSLQDQLRQAQKLESVGRLAGGVAHDFNNLLTVILSCSEAMGQALSAGRPVDPADAAEIQAAGERARDLTRQLLAFARKQVIAPVALDLTQVVERSHKLLRRVLGEDVDLVLQLQPGLWPVLADPGQVEQVLMNLAVNARDAMPSGGTLTIRTSNVTLAAPVAAAETAADPCDCVELTVSDTGTGMSEEVRAHLFEPFFTTKEPGKGTGLGLATVYGIVHQSGGQIRLDSAPGQGTTFVVALPRTRALERPVSPGLRPMGGRGSETILLVEDEETVRGVMVRMLAAAGYRVLTAAGGAEALALARSAPGPIHLVISDLIMPGMDGMALVRSLRQASPGLAALLVSGYTGDVLDRPGRLLPGTALLAKPFTGTTLLERVRQALDGA
jgi:PAS domain S-box-containing protein